MLTILIVAAVAAGAGIYVGGTAKAKAIETKLKALETQAVTDVKTVIAEVRKHL